MKNIEGEGRGGGSCPPGKGNETKLVDVCGSGEGAVGDRLSVVREGS